MRRSRRGRRRTSTQPSLVINVLPLVGAQHAAPLLGNQHRFGLSFPPFRSITELFVAIIAQISISSFSRPCRTSAPSASSAHPPLPGIAAAPHLSSESVPARPWASSYARQPPQRAHRPSSYASTLPSSHSRPRPRPPPPSPSKKRGSLVPPHSPY